MPDPNVGWYVKCYGPGQWIWGVATDGGKVIGTGIDTYKETAIRSVWAVIQEHFLEPVSELRGDYNAVKEFLENLPEFGEATYDPERPEEDGDTGAGTADEDVPGERDGGTREDAGTIG